MDVSNVPNPTAYHTPMKHVLDLYPIVASKVAPPVLAVAGPVWPTVELVAAVMGFADVVGAKFPDVGTYLAGNISYFKMSDADRANFETSLKTD